MARLCMHQCCELRFEERCAISDDCRIGGEHLHVIVGSREHHLLRSLYVSDHGTENTLIWDSVVCKQVENVPERPDSR